MTLAADWTYAMVREVVEGEIGREATVWRADDPRLCADQALQSAAPAVAQKQEAGGGAK